MEKNRLWILAIVGIIVVGGIAWGLNSVLGRPEEASAPISAVPLAEEGEEEVVEEPTALPPTAPPPTATPEPEPTATAEVEEEEAPPTATAEPTATPEPTLTPTPEPEPILYEISQDGSQVSFTLGELLAGEPKTVVGVTDQVAGQISVDLNDLSTAQIGTILVNARTLSTDSNFRNRSIRNLILETDTYEFITFEPTELVGLPAQAAVGETVEFQIVGNLTIREITNEVVFDATVTAVSESELSGTAITSVERADYELVIPQVDGVANVDETVVLSIEFVAPAVEGGGR